MNDIEQEVLKLRSLQIDAVVVRIMKSRKVMMLTELIAQTIK